jgi:hypothetical protein
MASSDSSDNTSTNHPCNILGRALECSSYYSNSTSYNHCPDTTDPVTDPTAHQSTYQAASVVDGNYTTKQGRVVFQAHKGKVIWSNVNIAHHTLVILSKHILLVPLPRMMKKVKLTYAKEEDAQTSYCIDCNQQSVAFQVKQNHGR